MLKKKNYLTQAERLQFTLPTQLNEILVGLLLGDLFARKRGQAGNTYLFFIQGLVHKDYLDHLYDLFKAYCMSTPKIYDVKPHKKTGKVYSGIRFTTYSLPCFNYYHNIFYPAGKKVVPLNIGELLTPLSLAYWIADDGGFDKSTGRIRLSTNSFTLEEVNLLASILNKKWDLKCAVHYNNGHVINIAARSVPAVQALLKDIMPSMMKHKIGL
uniref:LAGLIDADG homing endonuclease n=1 Tax=Rhizoctonia solani TaxID=456999 RepID=A0A8E8GQR8_9AGAM|nr:LAGLIDADG homing endonuclease [Rhizoctonia solani]